MRKLISLCFGSIVALVLAATAAVPAFAQGSQVYPQKQYYAADYGQWQIKGQTANSYSFQPGTLCLVPSPVSGSFFPFNTNAPVLVADSTASNSEVLTPASTTNTNALCSVALTAINSHFSFNLMSGTAGLQETLNQISSGNVYSAIVYLDRSWWQAAGSILSTVTGQSIIASATGSAAATLIDTTTAPWTTYNWDGAHYQRNGSTANGFNQRQSSVTNLTVPTAISTAAATNGLLTTGTTGGTVPASSTYRMGFTYVDASGGETTLSVDSASTATLATGTGATNTLSVTSPAAQVGAVGYRVYLTAASGASLSEILYSPTCTATTLQTVLAGVCAIGQPATITAIVTGTATVPVVNTAYARLGGYSNSYLPFPALGTQATTVVGDLATMNLPAGYMNSLGKSVELCGNGYATTNSTPGTLTLATTLASLVGTTSITPFTAVSGTTTASATVPFNFCETFTTSATGATGTLEAHGWVTYGLAGTAPGTQSQDIIIVASATVDLTKQDQLAITIKPTTTGTTAAQLRQLNVYTSN